MQDVPQPLDGVEMRTIGWQKVQDDALCAVSQPFLHGLAVMIASIVEKNVDFAFVFVDDLEVFEQLNGGEGINRQIVHERELACCEVQSAVDIDAPPPGIAQDMQLLSALDPDFPRSTICVG